MNKLLFGYVALVGLFVVSESLTCNTCGGIAGFCLFGSTTNCNNNQLNCFTGQAVFNISSIPNFKDKGCMGPEFCNTTTTGNILGVSYTVTQTCCSTNLCNGAGAIKLHLTVVLVAALVAIWSTFV